MAVVLAPSRLLREAEEMRTGDMVANSDLGAEAFRSHVSARAIEAVCLLMVDSFDLETLMQVIPSMLHRHAQSFASRCERE